jgi:hypothetical protein
VWARSQALGILLGLHGWLGYREFFIFGVIVGVAGF